MIKFVEKIRDFMIGRYGIDKMSVALLLFYFLFNGVGSLMGNRVARICFYFAALSVLAYSVFRMLSKNIYKRQQEAQYFENFLLRINFSENIGKLRVKRKKLFLRFKYIKTHRFRTCPYCKEYLRLSKRKGKREITCPKCGNNFKIHILF